MDFSEQSITSHRTEDDIGIEFMDEGGPSSGPSSAIQRGQWSRMSLPPRLTYLEGYIDRARHLVISRQREDDLDGCLDEGMSDKDDISPIDNNSQVENVGLGLPEVEVEITDKQKENGCVDHNSDKSQSCSVNISVNVDTSFIENSKHEDHPHNVDGGTYHFSAKGNDYEVNTVDVQNTDEKNMKVVCGGDQQNLNIEATVELSEEGDI